MREAMSATLTHESKVADSGDSEDEEGSGEEDSE